MIDGSENESLSKNKYLRARKIHVSRTPFWPGHLQSPFSLRNQGWLSTKFSTYPDKLVGKRVNPVCVSSVCITSCQGLSPPVWKTCGFSTSHQHSHLPFRARKTEPFHTFSRLPGPLSTNAHPYQHHQILIISLHKDSEEHSE